MSAQTSSATPARGPKGWRSRLPVLTVVVAVVAGVVAAVTGATASVDAMKFLPPGHWVFNSPARLLLHIDGATSRIDAHGGISGDYGDRVQVVQGDSSGYVIGDDRITVFGKSDLSVVDQHEPAADETPIGLEVPGGPYAVYRDAGQITRFGEEPLTMSASGPVGDPVATSDGTLWMARKGSPFLCSLAPAATSIDCSVLVPNGNPGVMSVVDDRPVFVDTEADMMHAVEDDGLGAGRSLGLEVPEDVQVAAHDVAGRLAILDPRNDDMHLVDAAGLDPAAAGEETVQVELTDGDYDGPVSTGDAVAVMDKKTRTLSTYDERGKRLGEKKLESESDADPRISRGQDNRIYVDGADGQHVLVVDQDGRVSDVDVPGQLEEGEDSGGKEQGPPAPPPSSPPPSSDPPAPDRSGPELPLPDQNDIPTQGQDQGQEQQQQQQQETTSPTPEPPPEPPPLPPSVPGAPGNPRATAGNASATVNWAVAPSNRAPITGYTVSWTGGGQQGSLTTGPGARNTTVNGLTNGVRYTFRISATNSVGTGPAVATNPVVPAVPVSRPGMPGALQVQFDANARTATMSWSPPNMNGGTLSHYVVGVTGMGNITVGGNSTTITNIPGPAGNLTFSVRAVTTNPNGGTLTGPAASRDRTDPIPTVTVTISRGAVTDEYCGELDDCRWTNGVSTGLPPNTDVVLATHSDWPSYKSNGYTGTTDANGVHDFEDRFAFGQPGYSLWITVTVVSTGEEYTSNRITVEAG